MIVTLAAAAVATANAAISNTAVASGTIITPTNIRHSQRRATEDDPPPTDFAAWPSPPEQVMFVMMTRLPCPSQGPESGCGSVKARQRTRHRHI